MINKMPSSYVTIVIPISRDTFLKDLFASLDELTCDLSTTSLFIYVDGSLKLFEKVREYVRLSKYTHKLCVYRKKGLPNISHMASRRKRIGDIHREMATYLKDHEFVLLIEDDTIVPPNTLEVLLKDMWSNSSVGFISGVELGRWGFTHIGGWQVDDLYDPKCITSIKNEGDLVDVVAAGFYCCLTRRTNYKSGDFIPFGKILGPDFSYGLDLKRKGFYNYINMSIKCVHKTPKEDITFGNSEIVQIKFDKIDGSRLGWKRSSTI